MRSSTRVSAVIWDFDGTLMDTRRKNLVVNRRLIEIVTGRPWRHWPFLASLEVYERMWRRVRNWRDLYMAEFGLTPEDTDRAGGLWTSLQAEESTPTEPFEGIPEVLRALREVPHGIVSQNSSDTIHALLQDVGLHDRFGTIIGYAEVARDRQKPHPEGLLACREALGDGNGIVLFVGDHPTDTECAIEANRVLEERGERPNVVPVAACFGVVCDTDEWHVQPHHVARHPRDVVAIVHRDRTGRLDG